MLPSPMRSSLDIVQIGNAPTLISTEMFIEMVPRWDRTVRAIHADPEADQALGWAQEMFAFTLALANAPAGPPKVVLNRFFMAQPPFDQVLKIDLCLVRLTGPVHWTYVICMSHHGQCSHV